MARPTKSVCLAWLGLALSCRGAVRDRFADPVDAAMGSASASVWSAPSAPSAPPSPPPVPAPAPVSSSTWLAISDASAGRCVVVRGPIELPVRVPVALGLHASTIEAVLNDDGRPRIVSRPVGPPPLGPVPAGRESAEGERSPGYAVPCAIAGDHVFCTDRTGAVHETLADGSEHVVASARSTSRIAAATLGGAHTLLGYLASRSTSEGWVSEAWLAVDDSPPRRVSEDGSGATAIALAPRGDAVLVLLVDARAALTAVHARRVLYDDREHLHFDDDAVVFVGGPGDRRTRAAVSLGPSAPGWALLPIARDVGSFGLAIVRLDDPPQVDEPVAWWMYPNGLDPAPVAEATGGPGSVSWVALVRPKTPEPTSSHLLELRKLAADGTLEAPDVIATTGNPTDVALAVDSFGAVWLGWMDSAGSWLERLACGLKAPSR